MEIISQLTSYNKGKLQKLKSCYSVYHAKLPKIIF